ncbi:MAG: ribonuclease J [Patescibacteria group bacterium]
MTQVTTDNQPTSSAPKPRSNFRKNKDRGRQRAPKSRHNIVTRSAKPESSNQTPIVSGLPTRAKLKIIALGGLGEVGKNMTVIEYDDPHAPDGGDILIIDLGFGFPDPDMPGVDLVLPDISYLDDKKHKIRGVIITHGHEDHIGGVPHLLPHINAPVYGTKLSIGFIEKKFEEYPILKNNKFFVFDPSETLQIGVFKIEPYRVVHSIMDSVGYAIHTPFGLIVTTGDFKLDPDPVDGRPTDMEKLARICEKDKVLLLMSDSCNVERTDLPIPEKELGKAFDEVFTIAKHRIIITSFGSQVSRMQQVIWAAEKYGRKISLVGRSMQERFEVATRLGYLKTQSPDLLISMHDVKKYAEDKVVILCTGSQGEERSALVRMSTGDHAQINIKKTDTIMLSASPIPGNEGSVVRMMDDLMRQGPNVIYNQKMTVHVSGHAFQNELTTMIETVKPEYFMPIHGEYHHLVLHREVAVRTGIPFDNCFVMENGHVLEIDERGMQVAEKRANSGIVIIDGAGVGDIGHIVLRDRQAMAQSGIFVVIITVAKRDGRMLTSPDIISRGFVYMREAEELIHGARDEIKHLIKSYAKRDPGNWKMVKDVIKDELAEYLYKHTKRRPMVIPVIIEI